MAFLSGAWRAAKSMLGYKNAEEEAEPIVIKRKKQQRRNEISDLLYKNYGFDISGYSMKQRTAEFLDKQFQAHASSANSISVPIGSVRALFQEYEQLGKNIGGIDEAAARPFTLARNAGRSPAGSPAARTGTAGFSVPAAAAAPTAAAAAAAAPVAANPHNYLTSAELQTMVPLTRRSPLPSGRLSPSQPVALAANQTARPKLTVGGQRRTGGKRKSQHRRKQTKRRASSKTRRSTRKH